MSKSYRFDFSKGINVVGDKSTLGPGWVTVANNVDLRSGLPSPYKAPTHFKSAPYGTTKIFEFRGKFYYSEGNRDYAAEYVDGRDRIYYIPTGGQARKIVSDVDVPLGQKPPAQAVAVASTEQLVPQVTVTKSSGSSEFVVGDTRSYRVSALTEGGTQPASGSVQVTITEDGQDIDVSWAACPSAIGYWVFASSSAGKERKITEVGPSATGITDRGQFPASGEAASNYDVVSQFRYIYTFERTVNNMTDESGPSPLSSVAPSGKGRLISFDTYSDGFFDNENTVTINKGTVTVTATADFATAAKISTATYNLVLNQTVFTTVAAHGFEEGEKIIFNAAFTDPLYRNKEFRVYNCSGSSFTIRNIKAPLDDLGDGKTRLASAYRTLIAFNAVPNTPVATGDAVYIALSGVSNSFTNGVYKARRFDDLSFWIDAYTTTAGTITASSDVKYVPKNGYVTYRNLYRTGDAGGYFLVKQVPIYDSSVVDDKVSLYLGDAISSYYTENGVEVMYAAPPTAMSSVVTHYGMLAAIHNNRVRWTPIGRPDAWPEVFYYEFPHKPIALASYGQALIVLCKDGIYRIDGNNPTQLSLSTTNAVNGCIAQYSVQKTHAGLAYLSDRGVMLFNGTDSTCITDTRIRSKFFTNPSGTTSPIYHWWHPTLMGYNYANLAYEDGILANAVNFAPLVDTVTAVGVTKDIKSFYNNGKYYLYYGNQSGYYPMNTTICIDLQMSDMPITTLGLKAIDVHVSDMEEAYALVPDSGLPYGGGGIEISGGINGVLPGPILLDMYIDTPGSVNGTHRIRQRDLSDGTGAWTTYCDLPASITTGNFTLEAWVFTYGTDVWVNAVNDFDDFATNLNMPNVISAYRLDTIDDNNAGSFTVVATNGYSLTTDPDQPRWEGNTANAGWATQQFLKPSNCYFPVYPGFSRRVDYTGVNAYQQVENPGMVSRQICSGILYTLPYHFTYAPKTTVSHVTVTDDLTQRRITYLMNPALEGKEIPPFSGHIVTKEEIYRVDAKVALSMSGYPGGGASMTEKLNTGDSFTAFWNGVDFRIAAEFEGFGTLPKRATAPLICSLPSYRKNESFARYAIGAYDYGAISYPNGLEGDPDTQNAQKYNFSTDVGTSYYYESCFNNYNSLVYPGTLPSITNANIVGAWNVPSQTYYLDAGIRKRSACPPEYYVCKSTVGNPRTESGRFFLVKSSNPNGDRYSIFSSILEDGRLLHIEGIETATPSLWIDGTKIKDY